MGPCGWEARGMPHVTAAKGGLVLKIGLDSAGRRFETASLKVAVTVPRLEGLTVSGACRVTLVGIRSDKDCKLRVSDASTLRGDLQAATVDLAAGGASRVTLKGSAKKARLSGDTVAGLELAEFSADSADVTLTGAS